jgi:polar amino acid transport system substrate-binding protein
MNGVNPRRPLGYLLVGCALALLSLLLPSPGERTGSTQLATQPSSPSPAAAPAPPGPACGQVQDSLRPDGSLPPPGAMPPGSTMAAIVARGRLIAGVDQSKYLAGFRDPVTGQLSGSDIDLVHQIATALFGDSSKVQYVPVSAADRQSVIQNGQVDMVVDTFTVTCARQRQVAFSTDYLMASQRLLVPAASGVREVEDLAGKRVCTSSGSTTENVLRQLPLRLHVMTLVGVPECVVAMQRGDADAVTSDDVILAGLAAQDPTTRVVGRALDHARYAVGMNRNAADLVRFVNGVLERGRADGSLAASDQRWYSGALNPVPTPPPANYQP